MTYFPGMKLKSRLEQKAEAIALARTEGESYPPSGASPEDIAAINLMPQVLRKVTAETVYVREVMAINDQLMHNGFRVETAGIAKIAELAPGAPVMCNHDTYSGAAALPSGRVFAARTEKRADGSTWARMRAWFPVTDITTEQIERMDGGAISEASVQIYYKMLECSICETDMYECAHSPRQTYDGKPCEGIIRDVTEFLELSMVWAGMAKGTQWMMAAARGAEAAEAADAEQMLAARDAMAGLYAREVSSGPGGAESRGSGPRAATIPGSRSVRGLDGLFTVKE